ncbi:MAG: hypothetical protein KC503_20935 [Myxococcales bacterium]|nr:hypothetical protein [Myxococcales bacterium]
MRVAALIIALAAAACGQRLPGAAARDASADAQRADLTGDITPEPDIEPDQPVARGECTTAGKICTHSDQCGATGMCVVLATSPRGVCACRCTPTGEVFDPACPIGERCRAIAYEPLAEHACVRLCTPRYGGNDCRAPLACAPETTRVSGQIDHGVCLALGCRTDADCSGRCDLPSGLCVSAGSGPSRIDAPCRADGECGAFERCEGGLCALRGCTFAKSVAQWACPSGTTCYRLTPGGSCRPTCDPAQAGHCRNHADGIECYAFNRVASGGVPIADAPLCTRELFRCGMFTTGTKSTLSCAILGLPGNPSAMLCRSALTGRPTHDPDGVCRDGLTSRYP